MSAEQNMALARRFMEARVKGDVDALEEMLPSDFVSHTKLLPEEEQGREGVIWAAAQVAGAISNASVVVEDQVAANDKVVTRFIVHSTHDRGEIMDLAPTGRQMTNRVILIHRICEGKIAEEWGIGTIGSNLRGQLLEQERIERERIEQELQVARRIQQASLPKEVPTLEGAHSRGLADLYLLPASQRGRGRLLRLPPTLRRAVRSGRGRRNGQGCARCTGYVHHLRHVAGRLTNLGRLIACRGA